MFSDFTDLTELTAGKFIYDLIIAILTGFFTGSTLEWWLRRREKEHWRAARDLLNADVLNVVNQLIKSLLAERYLERLEEYCKFGESAFASSYGLVRPKDELMIQGSLMNCEWAAEVARSLPDPNDPPDLDRRTPYVSAFRKAQDSLNGLYERHGSLLEPDQREFLGELNGHLATLTDFITLREFWKRPDATKVFGELLASTLLRVDQTRLRQTEYGILITLSPPSTTLPPRREPPKPTLPP